jgi:hypothetical protein
LESIKGLKVATGDSAHLFSAVFLTLRIVFYESLLMEFIQLKFYDSPRFESALTQNINHGMHCVPEMEYTLQKNG